MTSRLCLTATSACLGLLAFFGLTRVLSAASAVAPLTAFTVDSPLDAVDEVLNGLCATAGGDCTLRAAIQEANAASDVVTILLPAGVYSLTLPGLNEDAAATGDLDILGGQVVQITGAGAAQTIINAAAQADRHFNVLAGASLSLDGVTLTGGDATAAISGGAIQSFGALTITHSALVSNTALGGGAIMNLEGATLTLSETTFLSNTTTGFFFGANGGALRNHGQAFITHSLFAGNVASPTQAIGGGLFNNLGATMTVASSVFSSNVALFGGGLGNQGVLTLTDSLLTGNSAAAGGGGLCNCGTPDTARLHLADTTLLTNTATGPSNGGGGVDNTGTLTFLNSTAAGNTAPFGGGLQNSGHLIVTNSTVSGNQANGVNGGGGIRNVGALTLTASTVTGNTSDQSGGGLRNFFTVTVASTIVAGNLAPAGPDLDIGFGTGVYVSQGENLIGIGDGIVGFGATDTVGTSAAPLDPLLGPLQDNGGATPTHRLAPTSPARDNTACNVTTPADQRGVARPQGPLCDTGAVEVGDYGLTVTLAGAGSGQVTSNPAGITCGVDCAETYFEGTVITLTATVSPTSRLAYWEGACSGAGACTITLGQTTSVTATFISHFIYLPLIVR